MKAIEFAKPGIEKLRDFTMNGGKRVRPILMIMGNRKKALEVVENALKTSPENLSLKALKSKIENLK